MLVELLPILDGCLLGGLSMLSCIVWSQHTQLKTLSRTVNAQHVEQVNKLATIERMTCYDALTGLRGQRLFETALATALRFGTPVALIYIDLDGIKQLNASRGHQFVDAVIRSAAMAIRASLRRSTDRDEVFRRGDAADEFFVILRGARLELGVAIANQILTMLRLLPTAVTASIGVAATNGLSSMSAADLERAAELAMEWAKSDGKNCVRPLVQRATPPRVPRREFYRTATRRLIRKRTPLSAPASQPLHAEQAEPEHMTPSALPADQQAIPESVPTEYPKRTPVAA
jgi:diguanylate cyclase (GGDEF)-like protein